MVTYLQMDLFHRIFEMFCFSVSAFPQVLKDLEKLKSLYFLIKTGGIGAKYMGTLWELKYSEILSYSSTEHFILSSLLWEAISIPPACRSSVRLQIPPANIILTFCASRRVNLSLTCKCKNIPYFVPRSSKNIWPPFRKRRIMLGPHNIEIKLKVRYA